jgi:hypothetical protein
VQRKALAVAVKGGQARRVQNARTTLSINAVWGLFALYSCSSFISGNSPDNLSLLEMRQIDERPSVHLDSAWNSLQSKPELVPVTPCGAESGASGSSAARHRKILPLMPISIEPT